MDLPEIQKNYPQISAAANDVLRLLGPGFTINPRVTWRQIFLQQQALRVCRSSVSRVLIYISSNLDRSYCRIWTPR